MFLQLLKAHPKLDHSSFLKEPYSRTAQAHEITLTNSNINAIYSTKNFMTRKLPQKVGQERSQKKGTFTRGVFTLKML